MFKNFLVTALRSLGKNRIYTSINVLGLSICFIALFFIVQYVHFEKSFDTYHSSYDRVFRVEMNLQYENSSTSSAGSYYAIGEQSKIDFPEVESFFTTTHNSAGHGFLTIDQDGTLQSFRLDKTFGASPSILSILDFEFLEGSAKSGLSGVTNVVITETLARRIFGDKPALGKQLTWYNTSTNVERSKAWQVGAVIKDPPQNSHFRFDLLFPLASFEAEYPEYRENIWSWYGYYTYLLLQSPGDRAKLEASYPDFIDQHMGGPNQRSYQPTFYLEPLDDIHLRSTAQNQIVEGGDYQTVNILILISMFLVILAYTNYINLVTSLNLQRAKEVGIRKVIGSSKVQLLTQFLIETVLVNIASFLLAALAIYGLKDLIPNWIGDYPDAYLWYDISFWILSASVVLVLALLAGIYPAMIIGRFENVDILKGNFSRSIKGKLLHKAMVISQFAIASVLILFTLTVNQQLNFMFEEEIGANIDQVFVARAPFNRSGLFESAIRNFQDKMTSIPEISTVSASTAIPGNTLWGASVSIEGKTNQRQVVRRMEVDEFYISTYQLQLSEGRNFFKGFGADRLGVIINEKATEVLGVSAKEILNRDLYLGGDETAKVIGVIKDYRHHSMKSEIMPMIMTKSDEDVYYVSMRLQTSDMQRTLKQIEALWEESFPGNPIDGFFANEHFQRLYAKEQKLGKIVSAFTTAALFIACLGIFGLSLFTLIRRRKEIGIRKVLGAHDTTLFWVFSKEILSLILVASLLAIPISYVFVNNWLDTFPNRVGLDAFMLTIPTLTTLSFALATIGYNISKALKVNPVETLRQD